MDLSEFDNLPTKEICYLLKDCKFNLFTKHSYDPSIDNDGNEVGYTSVPWIGGEATLACPTIYEIQKWLREVHGIHVVIRPHVNDSNGDDFVDYVCYWIMIVKFETDSVPCGTHKSYEEALKSCEKDALDFVKTRLNETESGQGDNTEEYRVGEE